MSQPFIGDDWMYSFIGDFFEDNRSFEKVYIGLGENLVTLI